MKDNLSINFLNKVSLLEEENTRLKQENKRLKQQVSDSNMSIKSLQAFYKEVEFELKRVKETESKLQKLINLSYDAVLFLNEEGIIQDCNHSCLKMFGYSNKADLIGKTPLDITAPSDIEKSKVAFRRVVNENINIKLEKKFVTKEGREFPAIVSSSRIDSGSGLITAIVQDISITKELETTQKNQIELLSKLAIVRNEINKTKNTEELKESICREIFRHTKANEVWLLKNENDKNKKFYYGYKNEEIQSFDLQEVTIEQNIVDTIFANPNYKFKKVYFVEGDDILKFPQFKNPQKIHTQLILVTKLLLGKSYAFGLNYFSHSDKIDSDREFIRNLSRLLNPAFEHINALEKLFEEKTKFRAITENLNDVIVVRNLEGRYTYVSPSIKKFGYTQEEILGKSAIDFIKKNDLHRVQQTVDKLILENKKSTIEYSVELNLKNGKSIITDLTIINMLNQKGVEGIVINSRDITQIKQAADKIVESEVRLRSIFESMNDGVYLCSSDYGVEYMNKAMRNQVGNLPLIGRKCHKLVYNQNKPCVWCKSSSLKEDENFTFEVFNPKNKRYYQISKSILNSKERNSILHISRDVTEIKQADSLIRESEEKFRNIFNLSNDAIFITNLMGKYEEANKIAVNRAGYSRNEFLKMSLLNVAHYSKNNNVVEYLQNVIDNESATTELFYVNNEGREFSTEISGRLIDYQGNTAILHISRDITARKEIERHILETTIQTEENERARFAQDIHDGIGPYLSATKFFLQTLSIENDTKERKKLIDKAVLSIDEVIQSVKEISNNISPHILKNFGLIPALKSFRKRINNKKAKINIFSNIEGKRFYDNLEISLFRIIIELVNNTFKYANASKIEISVMNIEQEIQLEFTHNGTGFNFEKKIDQGNGNGLYNILNRVNSLKGECHFETSENTGFNFKANFITL